ncbi:NHL repeat-containing protein [Mucilaginibacter sp. BT774]|uniref:NHL repeat-containing protein n=1 Tax=Mucilaginibacter sp. BT774 TaxID=3062276 RepID=UPI002676DA58|nr:NHL repeat-containing protein [Mucilaginibacter sp. BT774]MDO3625535.1 NHL repeat-containing protein [Mucilaginibacter sp. BT774]
MKPTNVFSRRYLSLLLLIFIAAACKKAEQSNVHEGPPADLPGYTYTFAGRGGAWGANNAKGNAATFAAPNGLAIDASGNFYVADQANNMIRKITPDGTVSTLAGNGTAGFRNGTGADVMFNNPTGVAVDALGNVFVADFGNNVIRKVTSAGAVTTYAGNGTVGFADGVDSLATFNGPDGIVVDRAGNVFVSDNHNVIRKIGTDKQVSTFAGKVFGGPGFANGIGSSANFSLPGGLAIDASDNIYVADNTNNMIRKITPAAVVTTLAGQLTPGLTDQQGELAAFKNPYYVAADATGNVYVTDNGNNVVRKITPNGTVTTLAGSGIVGSSNGKNLSATFNNLHGIAVDAKGNVFVCDETNNQIRKIIPDITQ